MDKSDIPLRFPSFQCPLIVQCPPVLSFSRFEQKTYRTKPMRVNNTSHSLSGILHCSMIGTTGDNFLRDSPVPASIPVQVTTIYYNCISNFWRILCQDRFYLSSTILYVDSLTKLVQPPEGAFYLRKFNISFCEKTPDIKKRQKKTSRYTLNIQTFQQ